MILAALTWSGPDWLWPAVALVAATLGLLLWSYRRTPAGGTAWACFALKLAGVAALAFCLMEPLWTGRRARPGANVFAVVADNSRSLQVRDAGSAQSRGESLRDLVLDARGTWQPALAATFDVRRYAFDARLQGVDGFGGLDFAGRSTALGASLRALGERLQGRPAAGILLFTDGNATDLRGALPALDGLPPVYPVVVGREAPVRDVAVGRVRVSESSFEDAPVSVEAEVTATGYRGVSVTARLVDRAGKVAQEQSLDGRADGETLGFRFRFKPEAPGLSFYRLEVAPAREQPTAGRPAVSTEATLDNNRRVVVVDRGQGPYRVLYVSGRPNWEFKFLNRAVQEDDQVQLVGLIRVAKREPKFDFRGRAGETSNPLYRGFDAQAPEQVERYDQPVLVRLGTRDELELRSGFPRRAEDLYGYHAIVVDDLEAEFFAPDQAALVQKFVAERGGGFLMLGGMESFREGGYARTPIGEMLPVYLDRDPETKKAGAPVRYRLAREGWLQAWARLRDNERDERTRLDALPSLRVLNRVSEVKPGASVVATAGEEGGAEFPALVVQRFGRGRTAALTAGDLWRWGMQDAGKHADLDKAWRQLMRWLVADVPRRVECTVEPVADDANGAVKLQVRVRDARYRPLDEAQVAVDVEPVGFGTEAASAAGKLRLTAEPASGEAGLYETVYVPRLAGGYKATAVATDSSGAEAGRAEAGWSSDLAAEEFRSLAPNVALLQEIARRTKGEVVAAERLPEFVRGLPDRQAPVMEPWSTPAWHTPFVFVFALACLAAEWGLRRWKGLP